MDNQHFLKKSKIKTKLFIQIKLNKSQRALKKEILWKKFMYL